MMFVARYNDGSCGVAEATDEAKARELLQSDEADFNPGLDRIVSLRPLSCAFVSRWYFGQKDSTDAMEIDRLCGVFGQGAMDEILCHEYPLIMSAHETCEQEEPLLDENADQETPLIYNCDQMKQLDRWSENLRRRVQQAIQLELERFK